MSIIESISFFFPSKNRHVYAPIFPGGSLSEAYTGLFVAILAPTNWERKGNVPALTMLLKAYITRNMTNIVAHGQLEAGQFFLSLTFFEVYT